MKSEYENRYKSGDRSANVVAFHHRDHVKKSMAKSKALKKKVK